MAVKLRWITGCYNRDGSAYHLKEGNQISTSFSGRLVFVTGSVWLSFPAHLYPMGRYLPDRLVEVPIWPNLQR